MGLLTAMGTGQGIFTCAGLGFSGSGKSKTGMLLACAVREHFKDDRPLAMADSEGGSEYLAKDCKFITGKDLLGLRTRSFDELMAAGKEAEAAASVFITDSCTHYWRDLCNVYLNRVNEVRASKGQGKRLDLEFQDWAAIKGKWARFTDFILTARLHSISLGRAGFEWDFETNEETGKKTLVKTGIKIKAEGEFTYEPSLVFHMERDQKIEGNSVVATYRTCTILKDRFGVIDGHSVNFNSDEKDIRKQYEAVQAFFLPHLNLLKAGAFAPMDTALKTDPEIGPDGDAQFYKERRDRAILCEEVQGEMLRVWPGQTGAEKKAKVEALEAAFGTRSWTAVENTNSERLREGLRRMKEIVAKVPAPTAGKKEE